jgi:hypothetical protein
VPHLLKHDAIDRETVRLLASGGCVAIFEGHAHGGREGFVDETQRPGEPVSTGQADTASQLVNRWTTVATNAGVSDV